MHKQSTLTWTEGMAFDVSLEGHHFPIDAQPEFGGVDAGPGPKALVLSALAGCAGMDVVSILTKMRQPFTALEVSAAANQTDTHPKVYEHFMVTFAVTGDVQPKKLWRAVALSRDQYCGVAAMLRAHSDITYVVHLNGEPVPEPAA